MVSKYNTRSTSTSSSQFLELKELDKKWITVSDLYPCIIEDPLQVYMKYKLFPHVSITDKVSSFHDSFHQKKNNLRQMLMNDMNLFYISEQLNHGRYKIFEKQLEHYYQHFLDYGQILRNFCSIPFFNNRAKLKTMVDVLLDKQLLKTFQNDTHEVDDFPQPYVIMMFASSKNMTNYLQYQAHFIRKTLKPFMSMVYLDRIYYFDGKAISIYSYDMNKYIIQDFDRKISDDIRWVRNCMSPNIHYELYPPSHPNLYPNMKAECKNSFYENWKRDYANDLKDITMLWKCFPKHRKRLHDHGIYSFLDPKFNVDMLEITSVKDKRIIQGMVDLAKSTDQSIDILGFIEIPTSDVQIYVDFETLDDIIYWIGIYTVYKDGSKDYEAFVSRSPTILEQERIMEAFVSKISQYSSKSVYYWWAEKRFWNRANNMNSLSIDIEFDDWIDLWDVFSSTPILIKDCFNFKLKGISAMMNRFGMIDISPPKELSNGMDSMVIARKFYQHNRLDDFDILASYNEFDCRVMYEMFTFVCKYYMCK